MNVILFERKLQGHILTRTEWENTCGNKCQAYENLWDLLEVCLAIYRVSTPLHQGPRFLCIDLLLRLTRSTRCPSGRLFRSIIVRRSQQLETPTEEPCQPMLWVVLWRLTWYQRRELVELTLDRHRMPEDIWKILTSLKRKMWEYWQSQGFTVYRIQER